MCKFWCNYTPVGCTTQAPKEKIDILQLCFSGSKMLQVDDEIWHTVVFVLEQSPSQRERERERERSERSERARERERERALSHISFAATSRCSLVRGHTQLPRQRHPQWVFSDASVRKGSIRDSDEPPPHASPPTNLSPRTPPLHVDLRSNVC